MYNELAERKRVFKLFKFFSGTSDEQALPLETLDIDRVLTMSILGKLGRFGNQLFQYAFLRICASQIDARVECPVWVGQYLFGHKDAPIAHNLPPAIEKFEDRPCEFELFPESVPFIETIKGSKSTRFSYDFLKEGGQGFDLWTLGIIHTSFYKPYQSLFRSLFQPIEEIKKPLDQGIRNLRKRGKTL